LALTSIVALITSTGCGRKQVTEAPEPANESSAQQHTITPATAARSTETDRPDPTAETRRAALEERIYFGFDQWDLSPAARAILGTKVEILRTAPAITLRVEGHADERGSDEYNLALSNRRASEVKRFLVQQGVDANRLEVVGYGEEQPMETGHDERAWSTNRRAEFRVTGGLSAR
jgi:peptidoglycan-associated lipoprotein